jgi:predicted transcriptional regulator of viral defense system
MAVTRDTRLKVAEQDIVRFFEDHRGKVFKRSQIDEILSEHREFWRLSYSTSGNEFVAFLLQETELQEVKLKFPSRTETRYLWGNASTYEVALSLKPDSYFTHYTAMFLHQLTEQVPNTVYLNQEQPPKPHRDTHLEQNSIDLAFERPVRVSKNIAKYGHERICVLNGMHTGKLGVIDGVGPQDETIRLTNVERTLMDATVRPLYSGGVFEVLNAYRMAKSTVSINSLAAMLKKLNYIYPYHQAVGFYLERSGVYKHSSIDLLRKFKITYDFYLTHQIRDKAYSEKWRLYYPRGL